MRQLNAVCIPAAARAAVGSWEDAAAFGVASEVVTEEIGNVGVGDEVVGGVSAEVGVAEVCG